MKTNPDRAMKTERRLSNAVAAMLLADALTAFNPASAHEAGYTFTKVATLGDRAPGPEGGHHVGDFEPYAINDKGEVGFASDLDTGSEGVFVGRPGHIRQIIRGGEPAPGGGTFGGYGILSYLGFNNEGDAAFC